MSVVEGGGSAHTCALSFLLIGLYREEVWAFLYAHNFIHLNFQLSRFVHMLCLSMDSSQGFVHKAPGCY